MRIPLAVLLSILAILISGISFAGEEETKPSLKIIVTDEKGNAVPDCRAMLAVGEKRATGWHGIMNDADAIMIPHYDLENYRLSHEGDIVYRSHGTIFVRAPGFLTAYRPIEIGSGRQIEKIQLKRGRTVTLTIRTADGRALPEDLSPLVMFEDYRKPAAWSWQRDRETREEFRPLSNWLSLQRVNNGNFKFQASEAFPPLYVHIDHRDVLRCYESEALDWEDMKDGKVTITLPKPGSLTATIDFPAKIDPAELPIRSFHVNANRPLDPDSSTIFPIKNESYERSDFDFRLKNIAPGKFYIYLRTEGEVPTKGRKANPGTFREFEIAELAAGEDKAVAFSFRTFDPEPFRGKHDVTLKIVDSIGKPVDGRKFSVMYSDLNYGRFEVASGTISDGTITIEGLNATDGMEHPKRYTLAVGKQRFRNIVGLFAVDSESDDQTMKFQLIPNVGDNAPELTGFDTITGEPFTLSDYEGQVVLLEFWTTGCGPCQGPLAELNAVAEEHTDDWKDKAVVIAVNLDKERERAKRHVESRGWVHCRNVWNGAGPSDSSENSSSDWTEREFGVNSYPTTVLIDQEGVIRYRGHPSSLDTVGRINEMITAE